MNILLKKDRYRPVILSKTKIIPLLAICFLLIALPFVTKNLYIIRLGSITMCFSLLAISIDLLTGYMGLSAYGNAAFFGLAAYIAAWFTKNTSIPFELIFLIAVAGTIVVATIFSFICRKVWGTTFLIVNLTLGQCIWGLAYRLAKVTGAEMGMPGISRPKTLFGFINIGKAWNYYLFIFAVFAIVIWLTFLLVNTPFGLTIQGIRMSRHRMNALGYNVLLHKQITYVISGAIAGVGGVLYVFLMNFVSPEVTNSMMMSKAFLMSLTGGIGTIAGGVIGAAIIVVVENLVSSVTERWCSILGLLYIFVAVVSPRGLIGLVKQIAEWIRTRRALKKQSDSAADKEVQK